MGLAGGGLWKPSNVVRLPSNVIWRQWTSHGDLVIGINLAELLSNRIIPNVTLCDHHRYTVLHPTLISSAPQLFRCSHDIVHCTDWPILKTGNSLTESSTLHCESGTAFHPPSLKLLLNLFQTMRKPSIKQTVYLLKVKVHAF